MLSLRKLMLMVIGVSCILLSPQIAVADPIHSHCATRPWSLTVNPNVNIDGGTSFRITVGAVQFDQAPPQVANCVYETSDITRIDLTLNFTNSSGIIEAKVGAENLTTRRSALPINATTSVFSFPNGKAGTTIQFTLHSVGNAFHVMQGDLFRIVLTSESPRPGGAITATMTASGNHYYVPEPATMFLLGTGLAGVALKMRKKPKGRKSG